MLSKRQSGSSRILPIIISAFLLLLLAMGVSWFLSSQQMQALTDVISRSTQIAKKMDIVASMTEMVRSRARLNMQMVHTDDVFERDELSQELNSKASQFIQLRQLLIETGINEQEKAIIDAQAVYINQVRDKLQEAADLALSDRPEDQEHAGHIILNDIYPAQGQIIDSFMRLMRLEKAEIDSIAEQSLFNLQQNTRFNQLIMAVFLFGALSIIGIMINDVRRIEKQLVLEKEKAQVTLRSIGDGVITVDKLGRIEYLNQVAVDIIGEVSDKLVGRKVNELFEEIFHDHTSKIWDHIEQVMGESGHVMESSDIRFSLKSKPELILKGNLAAIVDGRHNVSGAVISFNDITESQALMKKIQHQASHDALTGLLNRRAFEEKVIQMLHLYDAGNNHAFCILDLDQFKIVNDSAGHSAGDELLRQLSGVLKPLLRKSDLLSRMGGDEFGVFLPNVTPNEAIRIADKLLNEVQSFGFYWKDNVYRVGASIGMVNVPTDIIDYEYLYQAADSACYVAKNEGRNQIHLMPLDADLMVRKAEESKRLQYLTQTLEQGQFYLFGQKIEPISERADRRTHIEVLLRMKDEQGEIIPPGAFIPIAERYGLMSNIDRWVLSRVCAHIKATPAEDSVYAVNLSGQTLSSKDLMKQMLAIIEQSDLPPGRLCLEVTETVAIANLECAGEFMSTVRETGCLIALDDFGSGLSSFSYLKSLPIDYLKIDGVFVKSLSEDNSSLVMVEAIHYIGSKLGLLTIAEFVEDEATVAVLKQIGVDMAQGFHFDRPKELALSS